MPKDKLGFKHSMEYLLDFLCYCYYVKADNVVSDITFDELEKIYCTLTGSKTAPMRAMERAEQYSNGIKYLYEEYKKRREEKNED